MYLLDLFFNLLYKKKILFFILRFLLLSSIKKNKLKKLLLLNNFLSLFFFIYLFHVFKFRNLQLASFNINMNNFYLVKFYNLINKNLFSNLFNNYFFNLNSVYFFWYFLNKDLFINLFLNLLMKNGKKHISYKILYYSLFNLKKLVGIEPLFLLKKSLSQTRFLFDIQFLKLRKKIITMPKLLSLKSQLSKSIKYIFNKFSFKQFKISKNKSFLSYSKKVSYIILNNLFFNNRLKKLITKENLIVKNNFNNLLKENYRYFNTAKKDKDLQKISYFKKKSKSYTKKDNILKYKANQILPIKKDLNLKKKFLFTKYQLNLQSKTKLKSKWF